jgi:hypothetical protein
MAQGPFDHPEAEVLAADQTSESIAVDDLIAEIKETADKLARDNASRGDLKILSRTLRELRYAFKVFRPYRHRRKVTVFGSARTPPEAPAYQQAVLFAQYMAAARWMVVTGAASGIMEAGNVGAGRAHSMGVNILLPFEQEANPIIAGDHKLVHLKYFFTRKLLFVKESHAAALFPGGFGTKDEGYEVLTLLQTGKRDMMPVVFVDEPGGDYWHDWAALLRKNLLGRGMIAPEDLSLFRVTDDAREAADEIIGFYRVYHSMRFVGDRLVVRVKQSLKPEFVEQLNQQFSSLLAGGSFQQTTALPEEANDEYLQDLPRLVFRFDRKSLGKLRLMIDAINAQAEGPPQAESADATSAALQADAVSP